ncbi:MAG: response regulator transcription factor [Acidimicrobiia bacterium]
MPSDRVGGRAHHPASGRARRVLVVDDDDTARRFLIRAIGRGGLEVTAASSGRDALAQIEAGCPDLVLLDSQMPEMSGEEVLRSLRSDPRTATLPVIVVTGRGGVHDRVAGLDAGADDLVSKPVHPDELLARVRVQLRRQSPGTDEIEDHPH